VPSNLRPSRNIQWAAAGTGSRPGGGGARGGRKRTSHFMEIPCRAQARDLRSPATGKNRSLARAAHAGARRRLQSRERDRQETWITRCGCGAGPVTPRNGQGTMVSMLEKNRSGAAGECVGKDRSTKGRVSGTRERFAAERPCAPSPVLGGVERPSVRAAAKGRPRASSGHFLPPRGSHRVDGVHRPTAEQTAVHFRRRRGPVVRRSGLAQMGPSRIETP